MKILHTADWHIGAKLNDLSRLDEQRMICKQIVNIAKNNNVDMVVIAGDMYDGIAPTSQAEKLLFETLIELSNEGNTAVIAIAGNHDEHLKLTAVQKIAQSKNIFLVGQQEKMDFDILKDKNITAVNSGLGFLEFKTKQGEHAVVATLPYPTYARYGKLKTDNKKLNDVVADWFAPAFDGFKNNTINLTLAHVPTYPQNGASRAVNFFEKLASKYDFVDRANLQSKAHYTALGNVHFPICVDEQSNMYYSGATINKWFDDPIQECSVNIVELNKNGLVSIDKVAINNKKLIMQRVGSYNEAIAFLNVVKNDIVKLVINDLNCISHEQIKQIKKNYPNVVDVTLEFDGAASIVTESKKDLTTKEVFEKFVENKTGKQSSSELTALFLELMGEIVYEAD